MHRSDSSNGRVHTSAAKKLPTAYQAAKERLERKYGGVRRQIAVNLEELDQFCPIRSRNVRDFEKVTDLLNIIVINLTEAGREEELGNEYLYIQVQKKMTESMLADYRRWLFDKSKPETVQSSRQCPIRETEFLTITAETIKGLGPLKNKDNRQQHLSVWRKSTKRSEEVKTKVSRMWRTGRNLEIQSIQVSRCENSLDISWKEQTLL